MRILKSKVVLIILCLLIYGNAYSQIFIGMTKNEIIQEMKDSQKNFKLNTSAINPHYNYLKYEDRINEITKLFFLSESDKCTMIRQMCDYSNIMEVEEDLNRKYSSIAQNIWEYKDNEKTYSIVLTEEEWFFTVTTKLQE